jgi:type II secretory pathway pseudopilin PulG
MQFIEIMHDHKGQTLVEVVVALGVVILLVTGLITGTVFSLKASQNSRARSLATKYVQEAIEIARKDREISWYNFTSLSGDYCMPENSISFLEAPVHSGTCNQSDYIKLDSPQIVFIRTVKFDSIAAVPSVNPDLIRVTATVTWKEGDTTRTSQATTDFTNWR